ncbi:hypothetical protein SARC_16385, partial [Sphaeroforma arctica JP610]
ETYNPKPYHPTSCPISSVVVALILVFQAIEIDGDSDVAAVTDYDDHYVATRVRMSAGTLNVVVLTQADAQPLISSSADGMSTCMQMRPNVGGVDLTYSLQTFNVRDTVCEKDANIFPELMCVQEDAAEDNEVR